MTECTAEVDQSDNMFDMRAQEQRMAENAQLRIVAMYAKTVVSGANA